MLFKHRSHGTSTTRRSSCFTPPHAPQRKGGYGFVRFGKHEDACKAICGMSGQSLGGRTLKCSWGKTGNPMLAAAPAMMGMGLPPGAMYMGPQGSPHMMMGPGGGMPMPGQPMMTPQSILPGMMPGPGLMMRPGGVPLVAGPTGPMQGKEGMGGDRGGMAQGQGQGPKGSGGSAQGPQAGGMPGALGAAPGGGPSGMFFAFSGNPYMARQDGPPAQGSAPPTQ